MIKYNRFKFCPKCKSKKIFNNSEKSFICKNCNFEYFHNCASSVAAIIETKNGIILTKRKLNPKKDFLDLPGGFTDYNESLEVALKREVKEEINLEIYDLSYFGSYPNKYIYKNVTYFTIDSVFICKAKSLKDIRKSKEIDNILFCHPEKIPILKLGFKSTKKAILEYLDYLNNKK